MKAISYGNLNANGSEISRIHLHIGDVNIIEEIKDRRFSPPPSDIPSLSFSPSPSPAALGAHSGEFDARNRNFRFRPTFDTPTHCARGDVSTVRFSRDACKLYNHEEAAVAVAAACQRTGRPSIPLSSSTGFHSVAATRDCTRRGETAVRSFVDSCTQPRPSLSKRWEFFMALLRLSPTTTDYYRN